MSQNKSIGKIFNYKAGRQIFSEGDIGKYLYSIREGQVEVMKGDTLLREMGPGETFGELGVLGSNVRTADVYAKTDVALEAFDNSTITGYIAETATIEERRAANNIIKYIDKLSQVAVEIDKLREEFPDKKNIDVYDKTLRDYIEKNPGMGKILNSVLKLEHLIKGDIKRKIDEV